MKNKKIIVLVVAAFVVLLMAVTNPSKAEFVSWAKETAMTGASNDMAKGMFALFGDAVIDNTTTQSNYVIFSVFDFNYGKGDTKVIGVFKNFIPLGSSY